MVVNGELFVNKVSFCGVEDGQYRPKLVVVHYIVIKYTLCETVVFYCLPFPKFHTHNRKDTISR